MDLVKGPGSAKTQRRTSKISESLARDLWQDPLPKSGRDKEVVVDLVKGPGSAKTQLRTSEISESLARDLWQDPLPKSGRDKEVVVDLVKGPGSAKTRLRTSEISESLARSLARSTTEERTGHSRTPRRLMPFSPNAKVDCVATTHPACCSLSLAVLNYVHHKADSRNTDSRRTYL